MAATKNNDQDHSTPENKPAAGRRRGLGRGLGALFEDEESTYPQPDMDSPAAPADTTRRMLGVDVLDPGDYQPRQYIDKQAIKELAESIAAHGVLQPLLVREKPGFAGRYEIIAGERRWRAAQEAGVHDVPVIIKDLDDETVLEIALIENLQREDLNILEEAQGYQRLINEFGHTQEKLAAAMGKSRSHVANTMRLLALPEPVQVLLRQGKLTAGHARALITADNPEDLAKTVVSQGLSVRQTEALAAGKKSPADKGSPSQTKPEKDIDTLALEQEITNILGMKVSIDMKGKGHAGLVKIDFKDLDQLDEILHRLSHHPDRHK